MSFLRANAIPLGAALVLFPLGALAVRWIKNNRNGPPPPRKVMQYTMVKVEPAPQPKPPPPPPPIAQPKIEEQPQTTRVDLKTQDFSAPDPRPQSDPGGGRLSLAAEGEGPGDAFNLVGNPGGRGLLSGGGLGESIGDGVGGGDGNGSHYGWYYARLAGEIEGALRKHKAITAASVRVEMRVWAEPSGRITRVQLLKSTGDARLDEAIQSVVGLELSEPPPADLPMPMIARLTARRPQ